jgi:hypothetical protein
LFPFVLSPEVAALSMSGSTLLVAINALMLKRTKLDGIRQADKTAPPVQPSMATRAKLKETVVIRQSLNYFTFLAITRCSAAIARYSRAMLLNFASSSWQRRTSCC